ncbi:MAG: bifunctional phosphoglucose/phosphomannose isomerase [Thermoplasmatota archaeon]
MNLDDVAGMQRIDKSGMLEAVARFPRQMEDAIARGEDIPVDFSFQGTELVICGMGGSAIGGEMLRFLLAPHAELPVMVNRSYSLPAFADEDTLVVAISYSGDTQETLSCFRQAVERGCTVMAVSSGGALRDMASRAHLYLPVPAGMQPRAALAYLLFPLLGVLEKLEVAPPLGQRTAVDTIRELSAAVAPPVPASSNRAKQMALSLTGPVLIYGADVMAAAATRWRQQLNENAEMAAFDFALPEANHNELMAWRHSPLDGATCILLRSPDDHPQIRRRLDFLHKTYAEQAQVIEVMTRGDSPLARLMYAVHLGDWVSVYAALARDIDPSPVPLIQELKRFLQERD